MIKDLWINLPVKDVKKSKEFFKKIGFNFNNEYPVNDEATSFIVGGKVLMLFSETAFKDFINNEISDTKKGVEVLLSFNVDARVEVDELYEKVQLAGGNIVRPCIDGGWLYGFGFTDLDGHNFNALYMDYAKMSN